MRKVLTMATLKTSQEIQAEIFAKVDEVLTAEEPENSVPNVKVEQKLYNQCEDAFGLFLDRIKCDLPFSTEEYLEFIKFLVMLVKNVDESYKEAYKYPYQGIVPVLETIERDWFQLSDFEKDKIGWRLRELGRKAEKHCKQRELQREDEERRVSRQQAADDLAQRMIQRLRGPWQ